MTNLSVEKKKKKRGRFCPTLLPMSPHTVKVMDCFSWPIRVYYEDTDAGGVVYHATYLRFMERARTEWLRALGFEQSRVRRELGLVFAVTHMDIRFLAPAQLDDTLAVSVQVVKQGLATWQMAQTITHNETGRTLVQATVKVVALNDRFKPTRIPAVFVTALAEITA